MAISLEQFVENLTRSGLFSAEEIRAFREGLPPERRPRDAQGLARELIQAKRLTRYQAAAVYQGKIKGLVFGEYTVLDQIGAGGMGQVLKARHRTMERIVALKVLPRRAMKLPEAVQRFQREVRAAARLQHPNIVTAFDAGEADGIHFLVMEYVDGKDLAQLVAERGALAVDEAVDYVVQAARGLEYAHSEGVVHRDIKPGNLLVDQRGNVKILDMGLARVFEGEETGADRLTSTGQVMGTCDYMAPEQAEDTHRADHRADVYSLGCTLYRLLTGRKPYDGETLIRILLAHREDPIPSLCDARPDVPAELDAACRKMLAKTPEARYQSMSEVIGALEACVARREPAGRVAAGGASGDGALTSFLQHLSQQEGSPEPPPAPAAEPTLRSQVERGTKPSVWKKLIPPNGSPAKLFLGIAGGVVALVVVVAMLFLVLGHGGEDRGHSPDAEAAAGPAEGADEQAERAKGEPPSDTGPPSPDDALLPTPEPPAVASASATLRATLADFAGPVSSLAFAPDGRKLTSNGNARGMLAVWDLLDGERTLTQRAHDEGVWGVAFADNGNQVAAGTYQRATVWTLDARNMRHAFRGQQSTIHAVAFAPGSALLATGSSDSTVWLWDVDAATTRWRKSDLGAYDALCFSPDGLTLAAAGWEGTVYLLDVFTGDEVGRLVGHEDRVGSVDFSRDGRTIASGSHDKTVRLWNTADRRQRLVLEHHDKVHSVSLSPDGAIVASACEDGLVLLRSTRSGDILAVLAEHSGPVRCVAFAPGGGVLASGGDDKTIRVWEVNITSAPSE